MTDWICPTLTFKDDASNRSLMHYVHAHGNGPNILFILGSTGQFYKVPQNDKFGIVKSAAQEMHNLGPQTPKLAVGITSSSLDETIELADFAESCGADYLVLMPLYLSQHSAKAKPAEIISEVLSATKKLPIMLYNHPEKTNGQNLEYPKDFINHSRIVAIKDSSGAIEIALHYKAVLGDTAKVYVGNEIVGLQHVVDGVVSGSSNILPVAWNYAVNRNLDGEVIKADFLAEKLVEFQKVYAANSIASFHYILKRLGIIASADLFDKSLELQETQKSSLETLMKDKDFVAMTKWNFMS